MSLRDPPSINKGVLTIESLSTDVIPRSQLVILVSRTTEQERRTPNNFTVKKIENRIQEATIIVTVIEDLRQFWSSQPDSKQRPKDYSPLLYQLSYGWLDRLAGPKIVADLL
uniref:Uncharacterized protein n=1 Tax=Onchocerca volvulus TaxID=6282 RepID=A0A8R1TPB4_ONCVO